MGEFFLDERDEVALRQLVADLLDVATRYYGTMGPDDLDSLYAACGTLERTARRIHRRPESNPEAKPEGR